MQIKIDKGVPLPPERMNRGGKWKSTVAQMNVGDSVGGLSENQVVGITSAIKRAGFKATQRKEDGGTFRIWKLEKE